MFVLFHVLIAMLCSMPTSLKKRWVILGALLPDLIDKPLQLIGIGNGRWWAHAPLLWMAVLGGVYLLSHNKPVVLALVLGIFSHLLFDLPGIPLWFPVISYPFPSEPGILAIWMATLFENSLIWITEGAAGAGLLTYSTFSILKHKQKPSIQVN
jgi:hypothetical protein